MRLVPADTQYDPEPVDAPRPPRRRRRWWAAAASLLLCAGVTTYLSREFSDARALRTVAVVPFWNTGAGVDSVLAHASTVSLVSPWMFGVTHDARVVPLDTVHPERQAVALQRLRDAGLPLMPTIANYSDGQWRPEPVQRMLHDPALRSRHLQEITTLAAAGGWKGIDIDYEELTAGDRAAFTTFVAGLAGALHARGLELSVDVFAKTSDRGYDERNQAQDYEALGRAADQVRVMAYDYHWSTSDPGPIAPVTWVHDVLDYARAHIRAQKLLLGIPLYGYDWVGRAGRPVSWSEVYRLSTGHSAAVRWDEASGSPWFTYTDAQGRQHVVWFENAYSSAVKIDIARSYGLRGVALWMYGQEDQVTWSRLSPGSGGSPAGGGR
jgi:spore germination protein YaaH